MLNTKIKGITEAVIDCAAQSVLIDGATTFVLLLLTRPSIALPETRYAILGHMATCLIRKNIKYLGYDPNRGFPYHFGVAVFAGSIGGATKYGIKAQLPMSSLDFQNKLKIGAINNALYEAADFITKKYSSTSALSPLPIEVLDEMLKSYFKLEHNVITGLAAGTLVSLTGQFLYPCVNSTSVYENIKNKYLNTSDPIVFCSYVIISLDLHDIQDACYPRKIHDLVMNSVLGPLDSIIEIMNGYTRDVDEISCLTDRNMCYVKHREMCAVDEFYCFHNQDTTGNLAD